MSMCRVFSCVVGRECLLWPVHSLGKSLLAFALLHFVLQGQICLLLQVSLDFLLLHSTPLWCTGHLFWVLVLEGLLGLHRTVQLQLYTVSETRLKANWGSEHELLIAKSDLNWKKVWITTRPFRCDLNQIPYDYTVEVRNRFKGLDHLPEELWTEEPSRLQFMRSLESDTTEKLHFHFSLSCIGEGNGNPLQCSCLEKPRDG